MSDPDRDAGEDEDGWKFDPDGESEAPPEASTPPEEDPDGWRFDLEDVDDEGIVRKSIEPGPVNRENAVFVLLGALAMVLVFVRLWMVLT
jgi:hypothetical protein